MTHCPYLEFLNETILILGILNLVSYFTKDRKTLSIYLSNTSFFVFAIHRYFTSIAINITSHIGYSTIVGVLYFVLWQ